MSGYTASPLDSSPDQQTIGELVLIGDVHGDPQKLSALLEQLESHLGAEQMEAAQLVFLGLAELDGKLSDPLIVQRLLRSRARW